MDVGAYLRRIEYHGPLEPSGRTLRHLHRQHLYSVPFENLDIALGIPIRLDAVALFEKVVVRRRGGFCYELNGLFHDLLAVMGFKVERLSARVARADGSLSPEFDHMLLKVSLEEPWLADVGFGDSSLDPVPMRASTANQDERSEFTVCESEGGLAFDLVRRLGDGTNLPQYRFTEVPRRMTEFAEMCYFHQTSPESHFTQNRICSKALPNGRITISGMRLIETSNGERRETLLENEKELRTCLAERFGIELGDDTDWSRLSR
jgi:N-hydroxyarylamine O-acetyltransferase